MEITISTNENDKTKSFLNLTYSLEDLHVAEHNLSNIFEALI